VIITICHIISTALIFKSTKKVLIKEYWFWIKHQSS
jgi:hypothetical protein